VEEELEANGLSQDQIHSIKRFIQIEGSNDEIIDALSEMRIDNDLFKEGLDEIETVVKYLRLFEVPESNFAIDLTIARGLDYYTGTVYETLLDEYPSIGSVCSGGRYDNLATYYTKQQLPGVGISIGLTRLFYQLMEAGIINTQESSLTKVLVIPMEGYMDESIKLAAALRKEDIFTQIYLEETKLGKKFNYADKMGIPFVIVIGEEEKKTGEYTLRDMKSGQQTKYDLNSLIEVLK
ncbi:MAG TPA: HisS family protein, partial [Tissierellaceae bacterium]|nr:HisS family protein [Tissierellaceae bacterium]